MIYHFTNKPGGHGNAQAAPGG